MMSLDPATEENDKQGCAQCQFYRSENKLLLQGILKPNDPNLARPAKGPCPPEYTDQQQNCPEHDPNCACHGPTMTKGMVAWAGGTSGPDFFINVFERPVDWWGQQHTVWGMLEGQDDIDLIYNTIFTLPTKKAGQLNMLQDKIKFAIQLE